jgi:acyl-CoA thioester hydrolase
MTPETYTHEIEVQFRDLDTRKHVNHVVYASYFEQAKGRLFDEVLGVSLADVNTVVRTLEVDFRAAIDPDRTVAVTLGPITIGTSSLTIEYEIADGDTVVATGRTVSVNLGEDGPEPLPEDWREALAPYTAVAEG